MPTQEKPQPDFYEDDPARVTVVKEPYKVLLAWKSPLRPFKIRTKEFYTNIGALVFLLCVILLFLNQIILILTILSLSFFAYAVNTVKPEEIEHKITNKGIESAKNKYIWDQLGRYWFEKKDTEGILFIENFSGFPIRLTLLLKDQKKEDLKKILSKYLIEEKPELTQIEVMGKWLSEKFVLETPKKPISNNENSPKPKPSKK